MSDQSESDNVEVPEVVDGPTPLVGAVDDESVDESVDHPAKVMRLGTMLKSLLAEVREASHDEGSRERLRSIYETSVEELSSALSPDLQDELTRLALPFGDEDVPSAAELQVAQAQLVGWLEGLVQGIQATLFAQQMAAQQQLQGMRRGQLPSGMAPEGAPPDSDGRPGVYL
ncbi:MAG: bacterial proteasome activator family protein [Acidimicrobiia bacterium]|nr:bacterial proteasome activator family protein [Acidimicrobiia bacterium]